MDSCEHTASREYKIKLLFIESPASISAGSYIYADYLDELPAINMASSPIQSPLSTEIDIKGSISTHTDVERTIGHEEHSIFERKTLSVLCI